MSRVNVRIDDDLKNEANELFNELGIDMSTAIKIFLKQSVRERRIPFMIGEPAANFQDRQDAIDGKGKVYKNVDEMIDAIDKY